jgi:hypothetical protein
MHVSPLTTLYEKVLGKVGVLKYFVYYFHDIIDIKQCCLLTPTLFILNICKLEKLFIYKLELNEGCIFFFVTIIIMCLVDEWVFLQNSCEQEVDLKRTNVMAFNTFKRRVI